MCFEESYLQNDSNLIRIFTFHKIRLHVPLRDSRFLLQKFPLWEKTMQINVRLSFEIKILRFVLSYPGKKALELST